MTHENAFVFVANNLDLMLIEISRLIGSSLSKQDIEFINRILLIEYLELVNLNYDLEKINLRRRCEKIVSYADVLKRNVISRRVRSVVFAKLFEPANTDKMAIDIIDEAKLHLIADEKLISESIEKLFSENKSALDEYKNKEKKRSKIFDFFVGKIHKDLNDRADPILVDKLVLSHLKKLI